MRGSVSPGKTNLSNCDNTRFAILSFTPVFTVRSGTVWRLSPEGSCDSTFQLRSSAPQTPKCDDQGQLQDATIMVMAKMRRSGPGPNCDDQGQGQNATMRSSSKMRRFWSGSGKAQNAPIIQNFPMRRFCARLMLCWEPCESHRLRRSGGGKFRPPEIGAFQPKCADLIPIRPVCDDVGGSANDMMR